MHISSTAASDVCASHLHHLGMNVEAGVAQLGDLLGQELHPLGGITEDN